MSVNRPSSKEDRKNRAAQEKVRRGDRLTASKLRQVWDNVERPTQDRRGRCEGPDLRVPIALLDIKVKHRAQSAIRPAIKDAKENCSPGHTWAAVDWPTGPGVRGQTTITFNLDQWISLMLAERERAEHAGFEAGKHHAAAMGSTSKSPSNSLGLVQIVSLKDFQP